MLALLAVLIALPAHADDRPELHLQASALKMQGAPQLYGSLRAVGEKDAYVGVKGLDRVGTIRAGNMHEPLGLEETTSSKYITFIERSLPSASTAQRSRAIRALIRSASSRAFPPSFGLGRPKGRFFNSSSAFL